MKKVLLLFLLAARCCFGQIGAGFPAAVMTGCGPPAAQTPPIACTAAYVSSTTTYLYNDRCGTGNTIHKCAMGSDGVTPAWQPPYQAPVLGVATSSTIAGGTFTLNQCTTPVMVTVTGATPGTNGAQGAYLWSSPPSATILGNFDPVPRVWVSAINTVSVMACAQGILSSVPSFQVKVFLY